MPLTLLAQLQSLAKAARRRDPAHIIAGIPAPLPWWLR
jgi:hypothetical protein